MSLFDQWWDATRKQTLLVQRCRECNAFQHYPRPLCTTCQSTALSFETAAGRGVVHSFTVIHRPPRPEVAVPYVLAIVELAEGPRMLSHIVGCPPDDVHCDQPVTLVWEPLEDGRHRPVFTPHA